MTGRGAREVGKRLLAWLPAPVDLYATDAVRWLANGAVRRRRRAQRRILASLGNPRDVLTGPFAGMRYPIRSAAQGGLLPKLFGTYESELWPAIAKVRDAPPDVVIDIGAAEGYYAVGLAHLLPRVAVVCFELEKPYHHVIRRLARANDVSDRLIVKGECTPDALQRVLAARPTSSVLVMCDCEGAEDLLLDPVAVPDLRRASVLCELHDALNPGVSRRVSDRFASSHDVLRFDSRPRTASDLPAGISLDHGDAAFALFEGRSGPMQWFLMTPKCAPPSGR